MRAVSRAPKANDRDRSCARTCAGPARRSRLAEKICGSLTELSLLTSVPARLISRCQRIYSPSFAVATNPWAMAWPDWTKVKTPLFSAANWGGQGLHPRGNKGGLTNHSATQGRVTSCGPLCLFCAHNRRCDMSDYLSAFGAKRTYYQYRAPARRPAPAACDSHANNSAI